jgi:leucyl aminopeptidase
MLPDRLIFPDHKELYLCSLNLNSPPMMPVISVSKHPIAGSNLIIVAKDVKKLPSGMLSQEEIEFLRKKSKEKDKGLLTINRFDKYLFFLKVKDAKSDSEKMLEKCRRAGESALTHLNSAKAEEILILDADAKGENLLAVAEGIVLGNYQFLKYKSKPEQKASALKRIVIISKNVDRNQVKNLNTLCEAVYRSRDLVNEPSSGLNAVKLASEFVIMGNEAGLNVEILDKQAIEALSMGGLLAVNKGSIDPPTFSIMEWKPENPVNKKPLVFVGKGIVFDTGGLSLKPPAAMESMKGDMAGASAVASAVYAIAKMNLPVHIYALIPATDNRPHGNAMAPGDVITIMNGTTVEVLNTDAEGRLILADALEYAKKLDPMLVIDLATLTGAASAAIGRFALVGMQAKARRYFDLLSVCGRECNERLVEFPLWEEYGEMIKSEIADLKNIGGLQAGAITAGKFLEKFTGYPWIHLDIAGPAFLDKKDGYRTTGGTGVGVRLLTNFTKKLLDHRF